MDDNRSAAIEPAEHQVDWPFEPDDAAAREKQHASPVLLLTQCGHRGDRDGMPSAIHVAQKQVSPTAETVDERDNAPRGGVRAPILGEVRD